MALEMLCVYRFVARNVEKSSINPTLEIFFHPHTVYSSKMFVEQLLWLLAQNSVSENGSIGMKLVLTIWKSLLPVFCPSKSLLPVFCPSKSLLPFLCPSHRTTNHKVW